MQRLSICYVRFDRHLPAKMFSSTMGSTEMWRGMFDAVIAGVFSR